MSCDSGVWVSGSECWHQLLETGDPEMIASQVMQVELIEHRLIKSLYKSFPSDMST